MNSLPRCFIPAPAWAEGQAIPIPPEETHHLIRVLRVEPGERVMVFDGAGREAEAEVESSGRLGLSVRLRQPVTHAPPAARVILFQAVLKGERMDDVVQKAVELGAAELVPLAADHSVVKLTASNAPHKRERWRAIALGAARQSGNPFLMEIREPVSAEASAAEAGGLDLSLFGSLEPGSLPLWDRLIDIRHRRGVRVGLWIGPEGDWSPAEYAALRRAGVKPVTLGPLVLRAETAAFYGLSVIGAGFTAGSATPAEP
jgi:16S rRNA (uracil1498-N3)-methyltransferase